MAMMETQKMRNPRGCVKIMNEKVLVNGLALWIYHCLCQSWCFFLLINGPQRMMPLLACFLPFGAMATLLHIRTKRKLSFNIWPPSSSHYTTFIALCFCPFFGLLFSFHTHCI